MGFGDLGKGLGSLGAGLTPKAKAKAETPATPTDEQSQEEVSEALAAFKEAADRERERFATATSPDYWFGVYFETQEQRDEFLAFLKANDLLEVQWVNGRKLAARMGCDLKSARLPRRSFKIDPKLAEMSM
jgi:hypothetical protein